LAFGFFKDKSKGPLEVRCPLCEHLQQESPLAISSYCKGCGAYLSFRKGGEIIARPQATPDPFAHRPSQPKIDIEYKPREERGPKPPSPPLGKRENPETGEPSETEPPKAAQEKSDDSIGSSPPPTHQKESVGEEFPPISESSDSSFPSKTEPSTQIEKSDAPPEEEDQEEVIPELSRFIRDASNGAHQDSGKKQLEQRRATCFECGDSHLANARSNSTQCRKCGRLISMEDLHIRESWSSRVQTLGDVFIHKKGIVLGAAIQCHNLFVEGDFTGSAECSGDLTLRRHGKIIGKVVCNRLMVEKRAKVEFLNTVQMNECKIDGLVTGNLACRGCLALEKKATLTGNIKVGTLTVADGAKHTGQIQMGGF